MKRKSERERSRPEVCFTLLELLVVLAILAILAAFLLPALSRVKETGKGTACLSNLRQVGIALQLYVQDHDNKLPVMSDSLVPTNLTEVPTNASATIDVVLSNYLGAVQVLRCPSDDQRLFERTGSSYSWNPLLNGKDADRLEMFAFAYDPHQVPVVFDKEPFHRARGPGKGINYLYADGHIKNLLVLDGLVAPLPKKE